MAPRIPSLLGDDLSPPPIPSEEAAAAAAAAAAAGVDHDAGIPPLQLPDGLPEAADAPPRWGFAWELPRPEDPFDFPDPVHVGDAHHVDAFDDEPFFDDHIVHGFADLDPEAADLAAEDEPGPEEAQAVGHVLFDAEDEPGPAEAQAVGHVLFDAEDEGDGDQEQENQEEEGDDYVPLFNLNDLLQPADSSDDEQEGGHAYGEMLGIVQIRSMDDLREIVLYPDKYSRTTSCIVVSYSFGHSDEMLQEIDWLSGDRDWRWVGNYAHLLEANQLKETLSRLDRDLNRFAKLLLDCRFDKELIHSLSGYLPQLAAGMTGLQPMNVRYYADAISEALKVLIDGLPSAAVPLDWVASIPGRIDHVRLSDCVAYILERIMSLGGEVVQYNDNVLPPDMPGGQAIMPGILDPAEEVEEEEEDELQEGENYVPLYDPRLMLLPEEDRRFLHWTLASIHTATSPMSTMTSPLSLSQ